ncbi:MAG: hypothetical protein JNM56_05645 [Planctomycetia bacterium]|nr:hypothetical protein [Planctomycetia bacterium]
MRNVTVKEMGAPPGHYLGKLVAIEDTNHIEYGAGIRFVFTVTTGEHTGRKVSRVTQAEPTPNNNLGKMLAGLLGRPLKSDEEVDLDQFIGREYHLVVETTEKGSTRVAAVSPVASV